MNANAVSSRGSAWQLALGGVAAAALLGATLVSIADPPPGSQSSSNSSTTTPPAREPTVVAWLAGESIDATALAAVGASASETTALVTAAKAYLVDHGAALNAARSAVATAKKALRDAEAAPKSESSSAAAVEAARQTLSEAQDAFDTARSAFRTAVLQGLSSDKRLLLDAVKRNRPTGLPLKYLVTDRSEAEAVRLRDALADRKIAEQREQEPSSTALSVIASADSDPAVATASVNLEMNLDAVRAAWSDAVASGAN